MEDTGVLQSFYLANFKDHRKQEMNTAGSDEC